jgi:hypothetical protein
MIKNATTLPKVYYGMHMLPGCAEYANGENGAYRIFINESTIKKMDSTFVGRPVYVDHVDKVDLKEIHAADGFVVDSFYNQVDGKHWAKFIVISDRGHQAIKDGFRLSNAYIPKSFGEGGVWNGIEYKKEVVEAEYEHLALVQNPRYDESIIFDTEQFKAYNESKQQDLKRFANSKGEKSMFTLWNKTKVENSAELENKMVSLPTCKKDKSVAECLAIADKFLNMEGFASDSHMVRVGEEEMSVEDLAAAYLKLLKEKQDSVDAPKENEGKKKNESKEDEDKDKKKDKKENESKEDEDEDKKKKDKKENDEDGDDDVVNKKKKNQSDTLKESNFYDDLMNAPVRALQNQTDTVLDLDGIALGRKRYGSGK